MANLPTTNYGIMDIEAINLGKTRSWPPRGNYSHIHQCLRKISVELWNGWAETFEFLPCIEFDELTMSEKFNFNHCYKYVHHLPYKPSNATISCLDGIDTIVNFFKGSGVETILYKGGNLEKDFCFLTGFQCINLEDFGVPKAPKELRHNPSLEVEFYHREMKRIVAENA